MPGIVRCPQSPVDGSVVHFPMSGPVQLISDGYQFYEAPLLSTPPPKYNPLLHSAVDVEKNPAWTWPWEFCTSSRPCSLAPSRQVRVPGPSLSPVLLPFRRPTGLLTWGSPRHGQCGQCADRSLHSHYTMASVECIGSLR